MYFVEWKILIVFNDNGEIAEIIHSPILSIVQIYRVIRIAIMIKIVEIIITIMTIG